MFYLRVDPHAIKANHEGGNEPCCVVDTDKAADVLRCYEVQIEGPSTLKLFRPNERVLQSTNVAVETEGPINVLTQNGEREVWRRLTTETSLP